MSAPISRLKLSLRLECALAVLLLVLYWAMSVSAIRHKSATFDEPIHLRAGYTAWHLSDYRIDPENGTLPSRWAAIPLLFTDVRFPETRGAENNFSEVLFLARMNMALVGVALGTTIFLISRHILGSIGGLISLTLFAFSPAMLAQGCLVTSDVTTALFFTLAAWTVWKLLHRISLITVLAAGLALGGLALSKMSAGVFALIAVATIALRIAGGRPLQIADRSISTRGRQVTAIVCALVACGVIAWLTIWTVYGFRYSMTNPDFDSGNLHERWAAVLQDRSSLLKVMPTLRTLKVLPEAYLFGFSYTLHHAASRTSFLFGHISTAGSLGFFPLVVMIKTPLPALLLIVLGTCIAIGYGLRKAGAPEANLYDFIPLALLCAGYAAVAIASRFNVGERHLFPAYPPLFILAGGGAVWLAANAGWRRLTVILLLCWSVGESLFIRPNYLAYFNETVGGPRNGYRCLVDSSLDWGQDLPALHDWLEAHHTNTYRRTYVAYFGADSLDDYHILATHLGRYRIEPLPPLTGGTYCVSATTLQGTFPPIVGHWTHAREEEYQSLAPKFAETSATSTTPEWEQRASHFSDLREARLCAYLRHRQPDEEIAYSILVYRLTDEDIQHALHEVPAELE